jgi:electron transfer flavoprotein beta subunit
MKYKHACTPTELVHETEDYIRLHDNHPYLDITEWNVDDLKADQDWLGLSGSPTKVQRVENIVFTVKESRNIDPVPESIDEMIAELIEHHHIG